ncbi:MAG TPA: hypothetical protein VGM54_25570 [Chthoniobacter sp.]
MEITRTEEQAILLTQIDPVVAELLRRVPGSADPSGSDAAKRRIFSKPTDDIEEEEFTNDWQEYVEPELAKLFQSAVEVVGGDLKKLRVDAISGEGTLTIANDHLEAWIHSLNQARLVLTERHKLLEEDLERTPPLAADPRSFLFTQLRFYADLQGVFLHVLEGR